MTPIWFLLALGGVLFLAAWRWQIYPHRPMVVLLSVPLILSLGLIVWPHTWPWLLGIDAVVVGILAIDIVSLSRPNSFSITRTTGLIASLGKPHRVTLTIVNAAQRDQPVWLRDGVPNGLEAEPDEFFVELPQRTRSELHYKLLAQRRGAFVLEHVFVRVRSRSGLWQRLLKIPCQSRLNVYPDMKQLEEYALLAPD